MALYPFNTVGLTALTAAGTTAATEVKASEVTFQVTVTNINTNAVVRFERLVSSGAFRATFDALLAKADEFYFVTFFCQNGV